MQQTKDSPILKRYFKAFKCHLRPGMYKKICENICCAKPVWIIPIVYFLKLFMDI